MDVDFQRYDGMLRSLPDFISFKGDYLLPCHFFETKKSGMFTAKAAAIGELTNLDQQTWSFLPGKKTVILPANIVTS